MDPTKIHFTKLPGQAHAHRCFSRTPQVPAVNVHAALLKSLSVRPNIYVFPASFFSYTVTIVVSLIFSSVLLPIIVASYIISWNKQLWSCSAYAIPCSPSHKPLISNSSPLTPYLFFSALRPPCTIQYPPIDFSLQKLLIVVVRQLLLAPRNYNKK